MKKLFLVITGLAVVAFINAQTLEEIVKKFSSAMKTDKLASIKTVKITGKVTAMGTEMPMTLFMKNPDKIKMVMSFNGQDIVQVFDGEKGYTVNPMSGSTQPIELTGDQIRQIQDNNVFNNAILNYFKAGKLTLAGEENVNGKPAYKVKADIEGTGPVYMFLDKDTFLMVKSTATVEQMGTPVSIESYMTDYMDVDGVVMPKKTTANANGMEAAIITYDKVEVNVPIDDTVFKIK